MAFNAIKNTTLNVLNREYSEKRAQKESIDLLRNRYKFANDLYRKDLYSHYGCVNAIEFSDSGQWLVSGGDDRRILLWDVQKAISGVGQPKVMKGEHNSNIFCLGFDSHCQRLFSAGNDELVMIHDSQTGETVDVILHNDAIYGLSVDPIDDNVFASACDDGRVCLWDIRGPTREPFVLARYTTAFHAVMYNPFESRLVATANTKEGIALWDVRKPRCVLQQFNSSLLSSQSAMSVRFNKNGTLILALRRRLPPVLYNLKSSYPIVEFDNCGYYNSCTMKSCSFGGDSDQYVLSGSDDFKLYMWKIPEQIFESGDSNSSEPTIWVDKADLVLTGHRSIVNQVRYNYANSIIASSGVEKVIKFWSTFPLPFGSGGLETKPIHKENRKVFSHEDYINLVLESGQFVTHDYSHQSVQEDPRMMAFFDSLVQRDIEGWTSDSSDSIDGESSFYELCWNAPYRSDDSHSNSNSSAHNSDNEESINGLNSHYFSYLDVISKRIESNELKSETNSNENDLSSPSTSAPVISSPSSVIRERLLLQKDSNIGLNRISKLITEKKKEQLKKIAKLTVRTTRKKLKRIQRRSSSKESAINVESDKKFDDVKKKLDYLAQQVNCDTTHNNQDKSERHPSRRNHRRLRFLTNQSDLVFNEVLPIVSSSSSSDSDDSNFVSGEELYHAISSEVQRMRHILSNDTDTGNTSDDSSDSFEMINDSLSANHKLCSNSEDEKQPNDCKTTNSLNNNNNNNSNITDKKDDEQKSLSVTQTKVNLLSNLVSHQYNDESDSDSDTDDQSSHVHEPVIHCPYKHNLCHASTSTANNDLKKSSIVFKPIDTRKRSYRKRKGSGKTAKDDKCNKDSDNNHN